MRFWLVVVASYRFSADLNLLLVCFVFSFADELLLLIRDRHDERHWQRYRDAFINCLLVLLLFLFRTLFLQKFHLVPAAHSLSPLFFHISHIDCFLKRFYMFCREPKKKTKSKSIYAKTPEKRKKKCFRSFLENVKSL